VQLNDTRKVVSDPGAKYSGAALSERTLVPDKGAWLGEISFDAWVKSAGQGTQTAKKAAAVKH
jgi:hypothetical protein